MEFRSTARCLACAFAALVLAAGTALGAADGSVSGQLTDPQGKPVAGASVNAESHRAGTREIRRRRFAPI